MYSNCRYITYGANFLIERKRAGAMVRILTSILNFHSYILDFRREKRYVHKSLLAILRRQVRSLMIISGSEGNSEMVHTSLQSILDKIRHTYDFFCAMLNVWLADRT